MLTRLLLLALVNPLFARECDVDDFTFEYTSCSDSGERWRVAVPRKGSLDCTTGVPPPQKGLNCSFSCSPGSYLDLETQKCRQCAAGRYSLGGGIRFDEFVSLPHGFTVENFDALQDQIMAEGGKTTKKCPELAGWVVMNSELMYIPTPCVSKLSFTTSLVRPGYVEYTYRLPKNSRGLSLNVVVRNEQCQSYRAEIRSLMLQVDKASRDKQDEAAGDWQKKRVELRTGPNVISWTVTSSSDSYMQTQPIHVAKIDIVGIAFTRQCTLCPAGTYSTEGATECTPCAAGSFSSKGSEQCGRCPDSQYSGPKATRCLDRPPCAPTDYYPINEPCVGGKTKTTYKKVLPAVCRDDLPGAAKLPPPSPEKPCPTCNPGMAMKEGVCQFCEKNHYSEGNKCQECPANTVPNYGLQYTQWHSLPPNMQTRCEYIAEDAASSCDIGDSWLASGDALVSSPTLRRGVALELILDVPQGFSNLLLPSSLRPSQQNPVAHVTIVFESTCADDSCVLYFIEEMYPSLPNSFFRFLASFNGTQPRRVWSHAVTRKNPARYMIAFIRSRAASGDDATSDHARILAINVTNVGHKGDEQGGGASFCQACPSDGRGCVPCPPGHYMTETDHVCTQCPAGTALNISSTRVGEGSCEKCGPNLDSPDGVECRSLGKFTIPGPNRTLTYDLSHLNNKSLSVTGVKVFAREGTSYFHLFNVSILGGQVECAETFDEKDIGLAGYETVHEVLHGSACRLTAIPAAGVNRSVAYVSPLLLGLRLAAITNERQHDGWTITEQSLEYSKNPADRPLDVHLFFSPTGMASDACPRGPALAVTVRCDPQEKGEQLRLSRACPDGTCDGCLYQAILESASACPVCTKDDYTVIKGECVDGQQTIHSIPDKQCVITGADRLERKQKCSVLSTHLQLLLTLGSFLLATLVCVLGWICQRNRKLEYRYMKLVESKGAGGEMHLPAAESCALEDDEEDDEDRVVFSKGKRSLFGSRSAKKEDSRAFVALENEDD